MHVRSLDHEAMVWLAARDSYEVEEKLVRPVTQQIDAQQIDAQQMGARQ